MIFEKDCFEKERERERSQPTTLPLGRTVTTMSRPYTAGPASSPYLPNFLSRLPRAAALLLIIMCTTMGFAPQAHADLTSFTATAGDGQVTVNWSWSGSDSAVVSWQYQVKEGSGAFSSWQLYSPFSKSKRSHTFTGLTNGTAYTYKMKGYEGFTASAILTTNPVTPKPVNISQVAVTSTPQSDPASGSGKVYGAGEKIQVTVTFIRAATVTGDPEFEIKLGNSGQVVAKRAPYVSGTGTTELVFEYTVLPTDVDNNGIWIEANALKLDADDMIQDGDSNPLTVTHVAPGSQRNHKVDGSRTPPVPNAAPTASNSTVTMKEDTVYTFQSSDFNFMDSDVGDELESVIIQTSPGAGSLLADGKAIPEEDLPEEVSVIDVAEGFLTYDPPDDANGNDYTTFMFKVNDGDVDSTDTYTMTINVQSVPDVTQVAVTSTPQSGTTPKKYGAGENIQVTATFDEAVTVTGDPVVNVEVGSNSRPAAYASGSRSTALVFEYTVVAEDADSDGISINANALTLDSNDKIEGSDNDTADITHAALAAQSDHKVDGTRTPPPTLPTGLTAVAGNAMVKLAWTAPEEAGTSPVTGYEYQRKEGSGSYGAWTATDHDLGVHQTVTGLTNNTAYTFRVRAVNAGGRGARVGGSVGDAEHRVPPGHRRRLHRRAGDNLLHHHHVRPRRAGAAA